MGFCLGNFPFLEKDIKSIDIYDLICQIGEKVVKLEKDQENLDSIVKELEADFKSLEEYVNQYLTDIEEIKEQIIIINQELSELSNNITEINNNLIALINSNFNTLKNYIDQQIEILNNRIDNIQIGSITVYDPTTGTEEPLQTVINNLYGVSNKDGLTATEFDSLELTATGFDAYEITAYEFDSQGKVILV